MATSRARLQGATVLTLSMVLLAACGQDTPISAPATVRLTVLANADHGGKPFANHMTQEVTSTPPYAGDPDGVGDALLTINVGQNEICWETSVSNITLPATASHIHHAVAGVRGPIVIALSPPNASGVAHGCRSDVDRDLLRDIMEHPADYYVNVHTSDYPAGAIRAQLER